MSHEKLKWMKDSLICVVENQICNLNETDTKELGEAIDMIKDLEEAIYYCTVTEAMNNPQKEKKWENHGEDKMYSDGGRGGRSNYGNSMSYMYADGQNSNSNTGSDSGGRNYYDGPMMRDEREGRSYNSRRMYMEAKHMNKDKATQLHELEKYMQELSQDIVEMITDASPEEKQYLEKKITALASKIGQMK